MLRVCRKAAGAAAQKCLHGSVPLCPRQPCRLYTTAGSSGASAGKIVGTGLLFLGGGVGGTILYAKWDPKFRANIEKSVPYSDQVFEMTLGPSTYSPPLPKKPVASESLKISSVSETGKDSKQPKAKAKEAESPAVKEPPLTGPQTLEEASTEAAHIISAISEVPSVPAPGTHHAEAEPLPDAPAKPPAGAECTECAHEDSHAVKERPPEEVAARLTQQEQAEKALLASLTAGLEEAMCRTAKVTLHAIEAQNAAVHAISVHTQKLKEAMDDSEVTLEEKSSQWRVLEDALQERSRTVDQASDTLLKARNELENLKGIIDKAKQSEIAGSRPQIIIAEEHLHNMLVDLDNVVNKVQSAQTEAKIVSQYSELVGEAKKQFQKELSSIMPDVQAGWKGLKLSDVGKLSPDDLNSLIAHAHRRIDQLNRELAEQRVREQLRMEAALKQQRQEDKKALDKAVATALERHHEELHLEKNRKVEEVREVMEVEMRTQLRRQAAAHTDHLRDVLKVQEQELRAQAQETLTRKIMEQEIEFRRANQEQLDQFTMDMNEAYARLKGLEEAIDSHATAEEQAQKAHQLWLSVEALNYTLKTAGADTPTEPLEGAVRAVRDSCGENEFAQVLTTALPTESLQRGVLSEASLRARFYSIRRLARRVAMIDETRNSLYQYFLSYLQSLLLFEQEQLSPPDKLTPDDLDTFKLLSYATYCMEHGDLELAAKFMNQLRGEPRRVAQDWLVEARLTLETRQIVSLLSAYANAVGLGTSQAQ
ncbi:MICOS complex subunit MIC60 isoform X2 [Brienomyrus brachyistius]|uniref:MICOS complex subunit MIC60 isoform X2 n=1 Tax=Brienomyrus brachyistius TaxID=42636 RepID=UPI0020B1BE15|nr:MICOS complex subunit MIC60 isoform X2 [Brienomyrus brachyistius]